MNDAELDRRIAHRFDEIAEEPWGTSELVAADVATRIRRHRRRRVGGRVTAAAVVVGVVAIGFVVRDEPGQPVTTVPPAPHAKPSVAPVELLTIGYREGPQIADPETGNASPIGPTMDLPWQWCNTCLIVRVRDRAFTAQNGRLFSFTAGDGRLRDIGSADRVFANAAGDGIEIVHGRDVQAATIDGSPVGAPRQLPSGYDLPEQPKAVGDGIIVANKHDFIGDLAVWTPATGEIRSLGRFNQLVDARTDADGTTLIAWTVCPTDDFPCSLVIADAEGRAHRVIDPPIVGNGFYLGGAFSPDGKTLAATVSLHPGNGSPDAGLAMVNVGTGGVHLVKGTDFGVGEPYGYVAWSPDGTTVFFTGVRAYRPSDGRITDLNFPGTYYSVAALPALDRSRQCPGTEQSWQRGPAPADESGDGLPMTGSASEAAAVLQTRGAVHERVWAEPGRAWSRRPDGSVKIVPETLYTIVVELDSAKLCPDAPGYSNGVPVIDLVKPE